MSIAGYDGWVETHLRIFGLDSASNGPMLLDWEPCFEDLGFSANELDAASRTILAKPPKWRSDHFAALKNAVVVARLHFRGMQMAAEEAKADRGVCVLCRGSGFVVVPHPQCIAYGEWQPSRFGRYDTAAVTCRCPLGSIRSASQDSGEATPKRRARPKQMTLESFEQRMPSWKAEMARIDGIKQRDRLAAANASSLDAQYGPLKRDVQTILGKFVQPPLGAGDAWE